MQKKKNNGNLIFVVLSLFIIMLVMLIIGIIRLVIQPTETTIIRNGELTKYEEVVGYVIRDEQVVDTSEYEGVMQKTLDDLTRVKNGGIIATYVSSSEQNLMKKIEEVDAKIQETMESQKTIYNNDAKALDASIQILLYDNLRNNKDITAINESKIKLNENIKKKAQIVGELSPVGSKLKELIDERTKYEKQINDAKKELHSPKAGLVSYRIDGFEEILTTNSISNLTIGALNSLKINSNQVIASSKTKVKVVDNFSCYIAIFMKSAESKEAKLDDKLYLRIENISNELIPATVEYISEEENGRLLFLKIENGVELLTKYRKLNLDVVWWNYSGLKLHKSLIGSKDVTTSNGNLISNVNYVTIKKAGYEDIAYIKVIKEFGDYAIVDNYSDEEYLELGFAEEEIKNFVTLKLYNEVVVNKQEE